jgi:hypothetical protein
LVYIGLVVIQSGGTTIHFRGFIKTDNLGTYNNSTAIGQSATITEVIKWFWDNGGSLSVLIPSTNTSALIVSGGVSVGRLWS